MAMDGDILGLAIYTALGLDATTLTPAQKTIVQEKWKTIAGVIISHIQSNAVVSTSVTTVVATAIPVQVVPATGTGATTAPGAGSGSGIGTVS